jgi:DHA1 family tetracycline resistance protein-like MFS transporter
VFTGLAMVFTDRLIRPLYLINFVCYVSIYGFFRMILVYMADAFQIPVEQATVTYAYFAAMSLVPSFLPIGAMTARFGLKPLCIGSAVLAGLTMIAVVVPSSQVSLWFTAGPVCLIGTVTLSACAALLANAVSADRQGRVMGNNQALQVGAEALSAVLGGGLATIVASLPLIVFGGLRIGAALLLAGVRVPVAAAEPGAAASAAA